MLSCNDESKIYEVYNEPPSSTGKATAITRHSDPNQHHPDE